MFEVIPKNTVQKFKGSRKKHQQKTVQVQISQKQGLLTLGPQSQESSRIDFRGFINLTRITILKPFSLTPNFFIIH